MAVEQQDSVEQVPLGVEDQEEIIRLYGTLQKGKAQLVSPEGKLRRLPDSLHHFLVELVSVLNAAKCVTIVQSQAKLTTVEAASLLGVSRQFLVNLLENNEIPFHKVGTHRRIYASDLFEYRTKRDLNRRDGIRALAAAEAADGLYDRKAEDGD